MMALPECYLFVFITNFLLQNTKDPQNLHFGKSFRKFSKCLFNNNLKCFEKGCIIHHQRSLVFCVKFGFSTDGLSKAD